MERAGNGWLIESLRDNRRVAKMYDDAAMRYFREAFEDAILRLPGVTPRKMFGSPCYMAAEALFAFLVTGGVVLTRLSEETRRRLVGGEAAGVSAKVFISGTKPMKNWLEIAIEGDDVQDAILALARESYENALAG